MQNLQAIDGKRAHLLESIAGELKLAILAGRFWHAREALLSGQDQPNGFLRHVAEHVPYYRNFHLCDDPNFGLGSFPLVSKETYVDDPASFTSAISFHHDGLNLKVKSSGTLGKPIEVKHDLASWYCFNYDCYRSMLRRIPGLLDEFEFGKIGVALITDKVNSLPDIVIMPALNNGLFRRFIMGVSQADDGDIVEYLSTHHLPVFYGKPHYIEQLAGINRRLGNKKIRPTVILVSGENLFEDTRKTLSRTFGCPVYNAYASAEGGLMAMECPYRKGLHIESNKLRLEVLGADGRLSETGTGELVLTNYCNWTTAFVHYRTGDKGSIELADCPCGYSGPSIVELPGREAVEFVMPNGAIKPQLLDTVFAHMPIKQFQVIQRKPNELIVKWIISDAGGDAQHACANPKNTIAQIRKGLRTISGAVQISIEQVDRITPIGGKVRRYVNEMVR